MYMVQSSHTPQRQWEARLISGWPVVSECGLFSVDIPLPDVAATANLMQDGQTDWVVSEYCYYSIHFWVARIMEA